MADFSTYPQEVVVELTKYTNNASYNINDMIASFSHFSFDASEELFMLRLFLVVLCY